MSAGITAVDDVWVVWVNTDLTEGRGFQVPKAICCAEATARRLARGANVQGSDGVVSREPAFTVNGRPYGPCDPEKLLSLHVAAEAP